MGAGQRPEQHHPGFGGLPGRQRAVFGQHPLKRPGGDQFHHNPWRAVGFDHVIDGDHTWVAELRRNLGLPQRALTQGRPLAVGHQAGQPHLLDRYVAGEHQVPGPPDGAHRTLADPVQQFIAPVDDASRPGNCLHGRDHTLNRHLDS
jgi:hypothetical protein